MIRFHPTRPGIFRLAAALAVLLLVAGTCYLWYRNRSGAANLSTDQQAYVDGFPRFTLKARVTSWAGAAPADSQQFTVCLTSADGTPIIDPHTDSPIQAMRVRGGDWTGDIGVTKQSSILKFAGGYGVPQYDYPSVAYLRVWNGTGSDACNGAAVTPAPTASDQAAQAVGATPAPTATPDAASASTGGQVPRTVEVTVTMQADGSSRTFSATMDGPVLGLLANKRGGVGEVLTMAEYNDRFWSAAASSKLAAADRPKLFTLSNWFVSGDDDNVATYSGAFAGMAAAGLNTSAMPAEGWVRQLAQAAGITKVSHNVAWPQPGSVFSWGWPADTAAHAVSVTRYAREAIQPYLDAGWKPSEIGEAQLQEEPNWDNAKAVQWLGSAANAADLKRFQDYLAAKGDLAPQDLGKASWAEVRPVAAPAGSGLAQKKLFVYTQQFFQDEAGAYASQWADALRAASGNPMLPVWSDYVNRNGLAYLTAKEADGSLPGTSYPDWPQISRTANVQPGTEDWFGNADEGLWGYFGDRLRSATQYLGRSFTGIIFTLSSTWDTSDAAGIAKRALALVGAGAKSLNYGCATAGYLFENQCAQVPKDTASFAGIIGQQAAVSSLLARSEDVLYPARRRTADTAILWPYSSQLWDPAYAGEFYGADWDYTTTYQVDRRLPFHLTEEYALWYDLVRERHLTVDFIDEADLASGRLDGYKALYVLEPNVPAEGQQAIASWVRGGGRLVREQSAGAYDRFNEPSTVLDLAAPLASAPASAIMNKTYADAAAQGSVTVAGATFDVIGPSAAFGTLPSGATVLAAFADGSPAAVERAVGKGTVLQTAFYAAGAHMRAEAKGIAGAAKLSDLLARPVEAAGVGPDVAVDSANVQVPLLVSDGGAAIVQTVLGDAPATLRYSVNVGGLAVASVTSSKRNEDIGFTQRGNTVSFTAPLEQADIIVFRAGTVVPPPPSADYSICLKLQADGVPSFGNAAVTVTPVAGGAAAYDKAGLATDASGNLSIDLGQQAGSAAYSVRVKADGYLGKKVGATSVEGACGSSVPVPLTPGDLNGDNSIDLADLVAMIRALNGGSDAMSALAATAFGHVPRLTDLVGVIRAFNESANGE